MPRHHRYLIAATCALSLAVSMFPARADEPTPYPGTKVIETRFGYGTLVDRLMKAVA